MKFKIITQDGYLIEEETEKVIMPAAMGRTEILTNHAPTVAILDPGRVVTSESKFKIEKGIVEIEHNNVTIYTKGVRGRA